MPVGIRPSLTFRPRAGDLPHAHKMREYRPTATPLLAEAAGLSRFRVLGFPSQHQPNAKPRHQLAPASLPRP